MAMNRKEYTTLVKIYMLSFLCALPLVIGLDILINAYVSLTVLIVIDVIIFVISGVIGYFIVEARKKNIAKKREEFLANKKERQDNQE